MQLKHKINKSRRPANAMFAIVFGGCCKYLGGLTMQTIEIVSVDQAKH